MTALENTDQAKTFLISRILAQAKLEGVALSNTEKKMLAYSSDEESRFAAINQAFEQECNEAEYEEKIAALVRNLRNSDTEDQTAWDDAEVLLRKGDHYLLVMIKMANTPKTISRRPPYDRLKLIATAAALVALSMVIGKVLAFF
jgi:hypothetical protein